MKKFNANKLNSILFYAICAVLVVIIVVSFAFFRVKENRNAKFIQQLQSQNQTEYDSSLQTYSEFGKIRSFTKDSPPIPVVVQPVIEFEKDNQPLFEEIQQKKSHLQNVFVNYFHTKTKKQLSALGEQKIKAEILQNLNENLSMGQIQNLYFDEFMFLD